MAYIDSGDDISLLLGQNHWKRMECTYSIFSSTPLLGI